MGKNDGLQRVQNEIDEKNGVKNVRHIVQVVMIMVGESKPVRIVPRNPQDADKDERLP